MTCPSCNESLPAGQGRCPSCGTLVALPTEGALAPDTLHLTPPARAKTEPLREIPGLKKKEKAAWKDEVRERVRHRRRRGSEPLPLFDDGDRAPVADVEPPPSSGARADTVSLDDTPLPETESAPFRDDDDLPLRPAAVVALDDEVASAVAARSGPALDAEPADEWSAEAPRVAPLRPVERPAHPAERVQASAIDAALLLGLSIVVVYFASRAAHTSVPGLRPAWPYVAGYLVFLGLVYAAYFTGTTGQTLGKIATGLRVVDRMGHPPGYMRSFGRAALGVIGIAAAFAGTVPMFFDPARRTLHDRLFRTRVVRN